jgi:murein DD-endopeptidase MepM/ murein hydrolase activator NlpD/LysM repeat protein
MMAAGTAALMAGCSDASRFSADPFADPFDRSPTHSSRPPRSVDRSATTGAISGATYSSPIKARPLAPPPKVASAPSAAPQSPATGGGVYNHWSAEGGTPITVADGDTPAILANRYGVPTDALLRTNGYSSAQQVQPGSRLVIPIYRATAVAPKPAAPAHIAKEDSEDARPAHKAEAHQAPVKPAKPERAAKADDDDEEAPAAKKASGKHVEAPAPKPSHLAKADKEDEDEKPAAKAKAAKPHAAAEDDEDEKPAAKAKPAKPHVAAKADDDEDEKPAAKAKPAKPHVAAKADDDEDEKPAAKAKAAKPHIAAKADDEEDEKPAAKAKAAKPHVAAKDDDEEDAKPAAKPKAHIAKAEKDDNEDEKPAAKAKPGKSRVAAQAEEDGEAKAAARSKSAREAKNKVAKAEAPAAPVEAPAPKVQEKREATRTAAAEAPAAESSKVDKTATSSVGAAEEEKPSDAAHPEFRWPARGRIIQGFASGGNDGINIAVPEGTAVKAAEGGTVVYAGSELKGYGNLVLIRHPNGFVSAYAHNGEMSVKRGDHVTRGQSIAKSGQSGNVASPQLHFELRKGATPVDPTNYLAGL